MIDLINYNGKQFYIVEDDNINLSEHCNYCDFKEYCDEFVDERLWFPCGATFSSNKVYLKENKEYGENRVH